MLLGGKGRQQLWPAKLGHYTSAQRYLIAPYLAADC